MKITQKLEQAKKEKRTWWSFEYFPPRTAQGLQNLVERIERMRLLGPEFIDITWHSGGRTSELTTEMIKFCQGTIGLETCMHLTCTNMQPEKIDVALAAAKDHGCRNVLALRGDPPAGKDVWEAVEGGFVHGVDLVRHIQKHYDDYFDIAVPGFPEHVLLPEEQLRLELEYLKEKVDLGCSWIFTQMFFDVNIFFSWVKAVREAGITVPIVPGVMPIQNWNGFQKATRMANTVIPQHFLDVLEPVKNNDEEVRKLGVKLVADMCRTILNSNLDIHGIHIYTMNLEKGTRMLLEELNLVPRIESIKPLPWRQCLTPGRRNETIRPIFWANRTKSYIARTENWDEYPNGRFGDARSPAYGEIDGYGISLKQTKQEALNIWGSPADFDAFKAVFHGFCVGKVPSLPWSEQGPSAEMRVIAESLARINDLGFLTINSQPAVNGAPSNDKVFGWGPSNGFVYQKAYLEFFVSPRLLAVFLPHIEQDVNVTYYVINKAGDLRTNTHPEGPNAVTWGVFPGKEIVQPTIVEAISFMAWKDEAYELGQQWANIYDEGTAAEEFVKSFFDTALLVNVVHNDFRRPDAIFEPFLKAAADYVAQKQVPNGQANGHAVIPNGHAH